MFHSRSPAHDCTHDDVKSRLPLLHLGGGWTWRRILIIDAISQRLELFYPIKSSDRITPLTSTATLSSIELHCHWKWNNVIDSYVTSIRTCMGWLHSFERVYHATFSKGPSSVICCGIKRAHNVDANSTSIKAKQSASHLNFIFQREINVG